MRNIFKASALALACIAGLSVTPIASASNNSVVIVYNETTGKHFYAWWQFLLYNSPQKKLVFTNRGAAGVQVEKSILPSLLYICDTLPCHEVGGAQIGQCSVVNGDTITIRTHSNGTNYLTSSGGSCSDL